PDYKDNVSGRYLMPWVRLHAVKDYLDMVMMLSEHPTIHQTFNLVPSLLQQIEDYANPGVLDYHQELTLLKGDYSDDQKRFILERFFDANPHHMIGKFPEYKRLYEKRQGLKSLEDGISLFSDGELSDITAFFNLCWFDPMWMKSRPELKALGQKHRGFTWDEKALILEIQRELVAQVIPTYKKFQDSGHIEITTTPYYHPILPLLIDSDSAKIGRPGAHLPKKRFQSEADARVHLERSVTQYRRLFGKDPKGIWPSEQSISPEAVKLFNEYGFSWAVSSEGNLARSLGIYWDKDAYGHYRNIHELASAYSYEGVNLLFRNLTLSDNIGFTYATMPPEDAAQDCYQRLKQIQQQMLLHPEVHAPVVTIALDGENCWESYQGDGAPFLHALYALLENDNTLKARTVQEYFEVACPAHAILPLNTLHSGSWIESDFHIWIGDSLKNSAWDLLSQTREDLVRWQTDNPQHLHLDKAWEEIYIAEGSDWFWWYGEPHNSGQDDQFDMQFRLHLKNVYHLMGSQYPDTLDIPLSSVNGKHVKGPTQLIQPTIDGIISSRDEWAGSGRFDLALGEGAMHRGDRLVTCLYY
ncbi:MAG: glycoside hydrolase, partial [Cyanobacteria bacterium]|nr:glycoside hydrolase [Cyanobacteriota bacterium]